MGGLVLSPATPFLGFLVELSEVFSKNFELSRIRVDSSFESSHFMQSIE
jgi:hypothetical protein